MKKLTLILSIFVFISCNEQKNMEEIKKRDDSLKALPDAIDSITINKDSTYIISHHNGKNDSFDLKYNRRYFLVSYNYQAKSDPSNTGNGSVSFYWNGFPRKVDIDSMICTMLPLERKCYKGMVIYSIFEFKNQQDFDDYSKDYNGSPEIKNKKQCQ